MRSQKPEPCLKTTRLDETIEVFQGEFGYHFECGEESVKWSSYFDFAEPLEALSICILHQECTQLDRLEQPAAIFELGTGRILHTNKAHYRWLGHGCIHLNRDTVLSRVLAPERVTSKIVSIGNRVVGLYQISNAVQAFEFNTNPESYEGLWASLIAFNGFAHYGVKSQEILSRWVELGDTPEFYRQYLRDLGKLDRLKGIA